MAEHGTLWLAKEMASNPSAYSISQLQDAVRRLLSAKNRSRHSAKAQEKAERRLRSIRMEIDRRVGKELYAAIANKETNHG